MTDKSTQDAPAEGNMKKDPDAWVTGDEPMTGAQRSYLKTLSEEAKQPFDENLTKAAASRRIEELQAITGRHPPGQRPQQPPGREPQPDDGQAGGGESSNRGSAAGRRQ